MFPYLFFSSYLERGKKMAIGLPFVKLGALAVKQATKPIVKFMVRATKQPHRQSYRSVIAAKALYIAFGRISVRGIAALAAEEPPAMTDDQLLDAGVELLLEVVAYVVAAAILWSEYRKSVVKEQGLKDVARKNEERIAALENVIFSAIEYNEQKKKSAAKDAKDKDIARANEERIAAPEKAIFSTLDALKK